MGDAADYLEEQELKKEYDPFDEMQQKKQLCPKCGAMMFIKEGPNYKFWGCPNFPECHGSLPMTGVKPNPGFESLPGVGRVEVVFAGGLVETYERSLFRILDRFIEVTDSAGDIVMYSVRNITKITMIRSE